VLTILIIPLLLLAGIFFGVRMAMRGWQGNLLDSHPCCSRCRFDLFGLSSGSPCPECGLTSDVPPLKGNRVRAPRRIAWGTGIASVCGLILAGMVFRAASPSSVQSLAPMWFLRIEARSGSLPAVHELAARIRSGTVRAKMLQTIADEANLKRRSESIQLYVAWGDVIDAALTSSLLDSVRSQKYLEESVGVSWYGDDEAVYFTFAPAVGPRSLIAFDAQIIGATLDGEPCSVAFIRTAVHIAHVVSPAPGETESAVLLPPQAIGKKLTVRWKVVIVDTLTGTSVSPDWLHTEVIHITVGSDGIFFGRRYRGDSPD
jgi:hypothetical protein